MKTIYTTNRAWRDFALLFILFTVISALSCAVNKLTAKTQPDMATTTAPALKIRRDFSGSVDEVVLKKVADDVIVSVQRHKEKFSGIEVLRFGNANSSLVAEMPRKFIWGDSPTFKDFEPNLENAPIEVKMFQKERDKYIENLREKYQADKDAALSEYNGRVEQELKEFRAYFVQEPTMFVHCTKFVSLAERIQKEDSFFNLTITDGWADCPEEQSAVQSFSIAGKHGIIQLTRSKDSQTNEQNLKDREKFLQMLFPDAKIFAPYQTANAVEYLVK